MVAMKNRQPRFFSDKQQGSTPPVMEHDCKSGPQENGGMNTQATADCQCCSTKDKLQETYVEKLGVAQSATRSKEE